MQTLFENVLTASLYGSVIIAALVLARPLLKKLPKKYLCLLWLLAFLRLLMPFDIPFDLSLQPDMAAITQPQAVVQPTIRDLPEPVPAVPENAPMPEDVEVVYSDAFTPPESIPEGLEGYYPPAEEGSQPLVIDWNRIGFYIWAAVACGLAGYSLLSFLLLKRRVREAVRCRDGVWECAGLETAFILGWVRPRVYLPMGLSADTRHHILRHERAHLQRKDHWLKLLGFLALAVHWFNPLVWAAWVLLCRDMELACDEQVVKDMGLSERKDYSAALLRCSTRKEHYLACPVAFGEVSVKARILSVLNYRRPRFWISLSGIVAILFVAVFFMTSPKDEEEILIERCQEAMETVMNAEAYHIAVSMDFMYAPSLVTIYEAEHWKLGENRLSHWYPDEDLSSAWRLIWDGQQCKKQESVNWPDGGPGPYSWQEADFLEIDENRLLPWFHEVNWNDHRFSVESHSLFGDTEEIVLHHFLDDFYETEYTMTFLLDKKGKLLSIDRKWVMYQGQACEGTYTTEFISFDAEEVAGKFREIGVTESGFDPKNNESDSWGVLFRVDDDVLSSRGSYVYIGQDGYGEGTLSTTNAYWLEKEVNGAWEKLPVLNTPEWPAGNVGIPTGNSTFGYVDWSGIYGPLEPGKYRMGKTVDCWIQKDGSVKTQDFYSEFEIIESVKSDSPEAVAAVERCYAAVEKLKNRDYVHMEAGWGDEWEMYWADSENYLHILHFPGPTQFPVEEWTSHDKELFPRTDTFVRYNGIGYREVRENPDLPVSDVLGIGVYRIFTPGMTDYNDRMPYVGYFERLNRVIEFPENVGVISNEMVRFKSGEFLLTYCFDENGDLEHLEFQSPGEDEDFIWWVDIHDTPQAQIDAAIRFYTEDPYIRSFSWEEARAKYTDEKFNIREDSFANNGGSPIAGPVDAAKLALREYPDLGDHLSVEIFRDEIAGMWKVTIQSYIDYQATYAFRDVYLTDDGETKLLVYEGPVRFDQKRK